ncbi:hypothetical protein SAMN02927900_05395 [Rhizobium mongolense subsp. loessense]|uniref:Uncharacterized protein n=1 Tax=Rhizobium mongolense subsp. loessense TaxID=158890 RepID=A0A1G4TNC3_9HYPH|nr:hypothetical protein SAMN02927900_05395 [Rhizobium mongolense subsp. loessense]
MVAKPTVYPEHFCSDRERMLHCASSVYEICAAAGRLRGAEELHVLTLSDIQHKIIRSYIREHGSRADPFDEDA